MAHTIEEHIILYYVPW